MSDPDSDGLTNLIEYALGYRPFEENQVEPPLNVRQLPSGQLEISYTRPEWLPDLSYGLEISNDGTNWRLVEDAGDKFLPTIHPATDPDAEIVVYRELPGDSTPLKARLRVELTKEKIAQSTDPVSITNSPLANN